MTMKLLAAVLGAVLVSPAAFAGDGHWSYEGPTGPSHWAKLDASFHACEIGKSQSPVNIDTKSVEILPIPPIEFSYSATLTGVANNGHTIQIDLPDAGSAHIDGVEYKLLQVHFHAPSEMTIDGKAYPLVAHLVHKDAVGKLAVIAVPFVEGAENGALRPVFANLPVKTGAMTALPSPFDAAELLPEDRNFYALTGSLTTPPCSEDVRWRILKAPAELSSAQLAVFRKLYPSNARPVQPLNGRKVQASH